MDGKCPPPKEGLVVFVILAEIAGFVGGWFFWRGFWGSVAGAVLGMWFVRVLVRGKMDLIRAARAPATRPRAISSLERATGQTAPDTAATPASYGCLRFPGIGGGCFFS